MGLTIKRVDKLINAGARGRFFDDAGLYLVIGGKNSANWTRRYELDHRAHWMGLGSAKTFTLDEARERNREVSKLLADDIDPLHQRQTERAARQAVQMKSRTFEECAHEYIARHRDEWRSAQHGLQWLVSLQKYVFDKIGNLPVTAIDKPLVLTILERPITGDKRHPESGKFWAARTVTADRVRNRIELVLNFAMAAGYRAEGPNPAAWSGLKDILAAPSKTARKVHHAAMAYAELPTFLAELRKREGVSPKALEFTILTAARTSEALAATWSEIDLTNKVWTIPPDRMKGGREHRVPLSPQAIALLKALPTENGNPNLFIGARGERIFGGVLQMLMKRTGATVHGFRSTFSDWAHERTGANNMIVEMSLAHSVGTDVERSYRRTDLFAKRAKLMADWAAFAASPPVSGSVVPMRRLP
jgi:integrase